MNNHLPNGTVLPYGLLGVDQQAGMAAFNKSYKNTQLRMGIVVAIYSVNNPNNHLKLTTEYDVLVLEQNENISYTNIIYRNCLGFEGMGSIPDFMEKNLRSQTENNNTDGAINTTNQNGPIVLLQCLDGFTEKAIIVSSLTHPDRATTLVDEQPRLQGEYNGVNIAVNPDGSTSLTFKGATNNNGDIIDSSQGNTVVQIATDGSFSVQHSAVTMQLERNGTVNITCTGPANIIAQGTTTIDGSTIKLGADAVQSVIKGNEFAEIFDNHVHYGNLGYETSPPLTTAEPSLSKHVFTE
jgi:hypothetical protein